jgi:peptidoglycan/LPS O-acetylase OafA/YrhL
LTPGRRTFGDILKTGHLPGLDGMRAVAVLVVMTYHFGFAFVPGDLGVSAFFTLSGFLITWLLLKEWNQAGDINLRRFYARRTLRIFPAYYVFLVLSISWDLFRGDDRIKPLIVPGLTYLVNYYNALHGHSDASIAHAWSLAVEEQFYLLWPAVFIFASSRGPAARQWFLVGAIVTPMLWRTVLYTTGVADSSYVYNAFDTRLDNLAVGCLLAVVAASPWFEKVARIVAERSWYPLITVVLLMISRQGLGALWHYGPGMTVDAILLAILIVQLMQLSGATLWKWLENPVIRYLGLISYPLYLYHQAAISLGTRVPGGWPVHLVVGFALSVAVASGSYWLIEKPFLRLKDRFQSSATRPA